MAPLKSVIVAISKPTAGGATWMNGSCGTMLKLSSKPPGIGRGSADAEANAAAGPRSPSAPSPPTAAALRPTNWRRDNDVAACLTTGSPPVGTDRCTTGTPSNRLPRSYNRGRRSQGGDLHLRRRLVRRIDVDERDDVAVPVVR